MRLRALVPLAALGVFILTADTCNVTGGTPAGSTSTPGGTITVASGKPMKDSNGESVTVAATLAKALDPSGFETVMPGQKCVGVTVAAMNGSSPGMDIPAERNQHRRCKRSEVHVR